MKKEQNAEKTKVRKLARTKEKVSQWTTNPLNEKVLDYHNYEMTKSESVLYFVAAFLVGGVVSQFFYGGLFQEDGVPTLLTYISNSAAFVIVGLLVGKVFLPVRSRQLAEKRRDTLRRQFRDMLESLTASLAANSTVRDAFSSAYTDMCMQYSDDALISKELDQLLKRYQASHDVFISLFGELKIHTSHGVLPESDLKSPKISRLLTFMLLSNKKALSSLEIVQEIWPEELEDKDEPGKKVKQLVYRLRQAFSIISDEQLILSTPSGYQFNPDLHITTDFQRFDELCIAAAKATSAINKVRLLEKAASLYQGKLLSAANGEHWLVHYANRYHLAFMSTVNELLKQLMDFHAYDLLHRDAALALTIAPENTKAYYWLIRSYQKQHMDEMAAGELAAAKQKLPEDEYQKLLNSLE